MKAVFDTNILIDFLNKFAQAKDELERYTQKHISIVTWMEVMVGATTEQESRVLRTFLNSFSLEPLSSEVAEQAVALRRTYRLQLPDAIVYATARQQGCLLVTRNSKDFSPDWPDVRLPYTV